MEREQEKETPPEVTEETAQIDVDQVSADLAEQHLEKDEAAIKEELLIEKVDFNCPVCTELLYKPITIPCGHTFCEYCLAVALSYQLRCPMCRAPCTLGISQLKVNVLLSAIIKQSFPDQSNKRALELDKGVVIDKEGRKKLIIGNTHELMRGSGTNNHKWKFFVTVLDITERLGEAPKLPASDYIEKVEVFLHPTFRPSRIVLAKEPFEVTRIGWCVFSIRGNVYFNPEYNLRPMGFEHLLSFDRNGTHKCYHLSFGTKK